MERFILKPLEAEAVHYNGDLKSIKKFLNIKDANYDQKSREFILPDGRVVNIGEWVWRYKGTESIHINNDDEFNSLFEKINN